MVNRETVQPVTTNDQYQLPQSLKVSLDTGDFDTFDEESPQGTMFVSGQQWAARDVRRWCAHLDLLSWTGRGGPTDRSVAEALGRRADELGGRRFSTSVDVVALYAGVHRSTALRAAQRLCTKGVLRRVQRGGGSASARWELLFADVEVPTGYEREPAEWVSSDWARTAALGKTAALIIHAAKGRTRKEVAAHAGLSRDVVTRHLRRLEALKVLRLEHGVYVVGDLEMWAEFFNTDGTHKREADKLAQRRQLQEQQRAQWCSDRSAATKEASLLDGPH